MTPQLEALDISMHLEDTPKNGENSVVLAQVQSQLASLTL